MRAFIYAKRFGDEKLGEDMMDYLRIWAKQQHYEIVGEMLNVEQTPLYSKQGVSALLEAIRFTRCDALIIADTTHLSLHPDEIIRFNSELLEEDCICYLSVEQTTLQDWVYEKKLEFAI